MATFARLRHLPVLRSRPRLQSAVRGTLQQKTQPGSATRARFATLDSGVHRARANRSRQAQQAQLGRRRRQAHVRVLVLKCYHPFVDKEVRKDELIKYDEMVVAKVLHALMFVYVQTNRQMMQPYRRTSPTSSAHATTAGRQSRGRVGCSCATPKRKMVRLTARNYAIFLEGRARRRQPLSPVPVCWVAGPFLVAILRSRLRLQSALESPQPVAPANKRPSQSATRARSGAYEGAYLIWRARGAKMNRPFGHVQYKKKEAGLPCWVPPVRPSAASENAAIFFCARRRPGTKGRVVMMMMN